MKRLLTGVVSLAAVIAAAAHAAPAAPPAAQLPGVTPEQGAALVALARTAMSRYLTRRTTPDELPIPKTLSDLSGLDNAAAVTLRSGGAVAGVSLHSHGTLCRNVIAAALRAMRSPKLPDRVDLKVLDSLTVEVEVLSPVRYVDRAELPEAFVPALTGLAYARGDDIARVLPSGAYVLGMDADQIRRAAMVQVRLTRENVDKTPRIGTFTTRHYVGSPNGRVVELFRGKDLSRRRNVTEADLRKAAERIGEYLLVHQGADGRYSPADRQVSLREHLLAACAMAELARRTGAARFADSAAAAVRYAAAFAGQQDDHTMVVPARPADQLVDTALLAIALGRLPKADDSARRLRAALLAGLARDLGAASRGAPSSRPVGSPEDLYVAFLALSDSGDTSSRPAKSLDRLRLALARIEPNTPAGWLWRFRAGLAERLLPPDGSAEIGPVPTQRPPDAQPDERGGFAAAGKGPSTSLTGLMAVCIRQALHPAGGKPPANAADLAKQLLDARRFCHAMIYQPGEAYFDAKGETWVGGVRAGPEAATVALPACAAAIEALLAD